MIHKGGNFLFVNPATETISGYSREELLQRNFWDLAHPDDKPMILEMAQKRAQGIPVPKRYEVRIIHKSGETRWVDITAERTEMDGELAFVATAFDITERKKTEENLRQSEERFRSLIDNAFDGIYLISDNKYQYVNERFCEITGYTYKELLDDAFHFETLLSQKGKQMLQQRYDDRKAGKKVPKTYELEIKPKGVCTRHVEVSTVKIIQEEKPFYIGIVRDITERKRNEKLQEKVVLAQQAARIKQNFLANMSHEMRTPMNGIIGMSSMLMKTSLTNDQLRYLQVIEESSKTLLNLINDVLHLSKIEAGKVQLEKDTVQTGKFLERIKALFTGPASAKKLDLSVEACPDFPKAFVADESRLMQVISNLMSNAIKFTAQGFVKVKFEQLENHHGSLTLKVSVADSGIGVKPEHRQIIFEEFSQVDDSRTRMQEGTGLGLAISKRIVEMMGGSMHLLSQPGAGSTFSFTFKAQSSFEGFAAKENHKGKNAGQNKLALSVLVVEDKLVNRLVAELMLKDLGCKVDIAENGLIAIEKIMRKKYDAVLMDIQMPVMDGVTATRELRKLKVKLPAIIGLSAEAMEGDAERYIAIGMDDYLTKPLEQNLLARKLREHCGN
jgi:PAS domain S-box-containing protein